MSDEPPPDGPGGKHQGDDPVDGVVWGVRVAAAWTWRLLLIGFGIYVLARIFDRVELVAFSFVLALFFTAVLHPLERALRRVPGPRSLSAALALLVGLAVLGGIAYFVTWQISSHYSQLGDQVSTTVDNISDWLHNGPLHLKSSDIDTITSNITKTIKDNQSTLISGAITTVQTVIETLGAFLLILLSTFFLLRDGAQIWAWTVRLFPRAAQQRLDTAGHAGWHTLGGYMRGQVLIALFHGVTVTILLFALQVPLAGAVGVVIFLGSFVPLIGLTVAGALAVAVTVLEHGLTAGIFVAIAIVLLVQVEAHFLQPFIMSRSVEVHPLAIALSVITGTLLYGIVGALLAVPFVAFLNTTIHALREKPELPTGAAGFPVQHRTEAGGDAIDATKPTGQEQAAEDAADDAEHDAADDAEDDAADDGERVAPRDRPDSADV